MRSRSPLLIAVLPLAIGAAAPLHGQEGFLFSRPIGHLTVRGGPVMHSANSDLYEFFTTELTLERKDFRAPSLGVELGFVVTPQLDVAMGVSWAQTDKQSEMRDWVDMDDQPIQQTTRLRTIPLTFSARYYPWSRGEALSELAWVPKKVTPYIGAGGGLTWYNLHQQGDFVQESDLSVFTDDYESASHAVTMVAMLGTDVWLSSKIGLNFEARYSSGSAKLTNDFVNWQDLDLSGVQAGVGLTIRW
jgi:outer membrane protein W